MQNRFLSLDGWRGIAILSVLFSHGAFNLGMASAEWVDCARLTPLRGDVGVDVFFCLSGFLITSLLLREEAATGRISWSRFMMRRILRIFPVYFAYLAFIFILSACLHWGYGFRQFAPSLTFTSGLWWRRYGTWNLAHFWSLAVEQQFYLSWPLFLILFSGARRVNVLIASLVLLPALRVLLLLFGPTWPLGVPFLCSDDYLLMGGLAAVLRPQLELWLTSARDARWLGFAVFVGSWVLINYGRHLGINEVPLRCFEHGPGTTLMAAGLTLLIVTTTLCPSGILAGLLNWRPLAAIGTISYSIYVWQEVILNPEVAHPAWCQKFPINICFAILAGAASYWVWERWFLALKQSLTRSPRDRPVEVPMSPRPT